MSSLTVRVEHSGVGELGRDLQQIRRRAPGQMRDTVRQGLIVTTALGRDHARGTARRHGKLYPRSFTWQMGGSSFQSGFFASPLPTVVSDDAGGAFSGFGATSYSGESGPDSARKQGGMSFEEGSRNQPPHRDVAYAARIGGQAFAGEAVRLLDGWFW